MRSRGREEARLVLALALGMAAISVYAMRRADPDLWGYLSYGRFFVEQGGPVEWDPFSYSCAGCTWVYFEYLSHISLWFAYSVGGALGLIALKCLLGGIAVGLVLKTIRGLDPRPEIWLPVYVLMLGITPRYFLFRPQLYTFAFFAYFVDVLIGHLAGRRTKLWLLVPATGLWANLHGGFLAGLGVIGLVLMLRIAQHLNRGTTVRRAVCEAGPLWTVLAGATAASLVNPQGWRLWQYLLSELSHDTNRRYIQEWMPLSFSRDAWSASTAVLLLVLVGAISAIAWRRGQLLELQPWQWLAASVPLAVLSALSVRHLPILSIWISPVLVLLLGSAHKLTKGWLGRLEMAVSCTLFVPALLTLSVVIANPAPGIIIPPGTLGKAEPYGAVEFIKASRLTGHLFLPLQWGSYATWELFPRIQVAMDGRNVSLYTQRMVRDNLEYYVHDDVDLDLPLRLGSHYVLVPKDAPISRSLEVDHRWRKFFEDPDCALFVRTDMARELLPRELANGAVVRPIKKRLDQFR